MKADSIIRARAPLLLAALEGFPHGLAHLPALNPVEAWIRTPRGGGSAYLTMVARRAFGLVRYPGFGDRKLAGIPVSRPEFWARLRPEDLEASTAELARLYEHTQAVLLAGQTRLSLNAYRVGDRLRLERGLRHKYGLYVATVAGRAEQAGHPSVRVQTDTLTSWSLTEGYTNGVGLVRDVPIADILLSSHTVALSGLEGTLSTVEDKWVVLNRHARGEMELAPADVILHRGYAGERIDTLATRVKAEENGYVRLDRNPLTLDGPLVRLAKRLERLPGIRWWAFPIRPRRP